MKKEDNIPIEIMYDIDRFEEGILSNLMNISPDTTEKIVKELPGEVSNKLIGILRDNKINHITQKQ